MPDIIDKVNPYMAAASAITNPLMAHLTNVKNRKFTREMYKTQRQDALSDWAMQNEYNSPRAQMQRFQEAGLNPHLIYGQQNEGATVRSSSASGGQASAPEIDTRGLMAGYDMRLKSAQADQLQRVVTQQMEDQHNKTLAEIIQIQSNTNKANLDAEGIKLDNQLKDRLQDVHVLQAGATLKQTQANTQFTINQDERAAWTTAQNLQKGFEEILTMRLGREHTRAVMKNLNLDAKLKQYEIDLNAKGIQKNDSVLTRVGITVANAVSEFFKKHSIREKITPEQQKELDKILEGIMY